ncbi:MULTISPECIES: DUF6232 family protein [unclassified Streptomyces]|uniref:DUF6232 family protein n=1 Tax=unclassified Streptomyces TaxID=2593676 RepID=UPI0022584B8E|nr:MULTISPECIES: DUF6232 family protein [unclassified Streptomyces]MCX4528643.1 DUF6232 family protein [Streptomyces sp. NBC_01551]MCX4540750.1 DUF6232 family protein [Streptomyces sp. NBC_01565]
MDTTEPPAGPPAEPPTPPPAQPQPRRPWEGRQPATPPQPHVPQGPPGSPPATGAGLATTLDVTITKRLLWVGGAAYPLENVARIYTFVLHPRRKDAVFLFVRRTALTLLVVMGFTFFAAIAGMLARRPEEQNYGSNLISFLWFGAVCAGVYFVAEMLTVLTASSHYVLAVESNGQSTALVTGRPEHLNTAVHQIAYAIEHPDTELRIQVQRLTISNPSNYFFGDAVNMYGGTGNVGMSNA